MKVVALIHKETKRMCFTFYELVLSILGASDEDTFIAISCWKSIPKTFNDSNPMILKNEDLNQYEVIPFEDLKTGTLLRHS